MIVPRFNVSVKAICWKVCGFDYSEIFSINRNCTIHLFICFNVILLNFPRLTTDMFLSCYQWLLQIVVEGFSRRFTMHFSTCRSEKLSFILFVRPSSHSFATLLVIRNTMPIIVSTSAKLVVSIDLIFWVVVSIKVLGCPFRQYCAMSNGNQTDHSHPPLHYSTQDRSPEPRHKYPTTLVLRCQ